MKQESPVSAITSIPALVATFAATAGWTVTGTSSAPILTRPGGGLSFRLDATISGNDHILSWTETGSTATSSARVVSPKLNGNTGTPAVSLPSKVYLISAMTPQPFLAIIIEYGFNSYRHLYLGNMVKAGSYTGGEIISGATPLAVAGPSGYPKTYRDAAYLFEARQTVHALANCGGVNVVHANNPTQWRRFHGPTSTPMGNFDNATVIGGFGDDINDGYIARGRSQYAASQVLVPINLYASMPITGDTLFAPLGYPAGICAVNMSDIDPTGEFLLGSQHWKVFPVFSKLTTTSIAVGTGWAAYESSGMVGYAYPID